MGYALFGHLPCKWRVLEILLDKERTVLRSLEILPRERTPRARTPRSG